MGKTLASPICFPMVSTNHNRMWTQASGWRHYGSSNQEIRELEKTDLRFLSTLIFLRMVNWAQVVYLGNGNQNRKGVDFSLGGGEWNTKTCWRTGEHDKDGDLIRHSWSYWDISWTLGHIGISPSRMDATWKQEKQDTKGSTHCISW